MILSYLLIWYNLVLYGQEAMTISPFFILDYYLQEEAMFLANYDKIVFNVNTEIFKQNEITPFYKGVLLSYSQFIDSDTNIDCSNYIGKSVLKMHTQLRQIKQNSLYWDIIYSKEDIKGKDCFGKKQFIRSDRLIIRWDKYKHIWYIHKRHKFIYIQTKEGYISNKKKKYKGYV